VGCPKGNVVIALGLVWIWAVLPMLLIWGPEGADNHSVATLRATEQRAGREIALDRQLYLKDAEGDRLRIFTREELPVREGLQEQPGTISVRARFLDESAIEILEAHRHWPGVRDLLSLVGLALLAILWGWRLLRERVDSAAGNPRN
jgi:hypothetical protein